MACRVEGAELVAEGGHLSLRGHLDYSTVPRLWPCALSVLEADEAGAVRLDLEGVEHMDSAGLAFLAGLARRARAAGRAVRLVGASTAVSTLISGAGLMPLFASQGTP